MSDFVMKPLFLFLKPRFFDRGGKPANKNKKRPRPFGLGRL